MPLSLKDENEKLVSKLEEKQSVVNEVSANVLGGGIVGLKFLSLDSPVQPRKTWAEGTIQEGGVFVDISGSKFVICKVETGHCLFPSRFFRPKSVQRDHRNLPKVKGPGLT